MTINAERQNDIKNSSAVLLRVWSPVETLSGGVTFSMDRSDIEEMTKDLIPLAEEKNAGEALMTTDYDDKWKFVLDFRKKYRT